MLYISSVSGSSKIKSEQTYVQDLLIKLKIQYETIDISQDIEKRDAMKEKVLAAGVSGFAPPRVLKDGKYIGGYEEFYEAAEAENLESLFQ